MLLRFDRFELDEDRYELRRVGGPEAPPEPIELQPKVMEVLRYLLRHADRTLPKEELLDAVWGDVAITEASLTRCISLARRALGEHDAEPRIIRTVRGRGYRIGVGVEAVAVASPAGSPWAPDLAPAAPADPRPGWRPRLRWALLAVGLGLAALAWLARPFHDLPVSERPPPGAHPPTAVAVLPFGDLRAPRSRSTEADALALEVIDRLSRWPELRVTSFRSSFRFSPAAPLDPAAVGRNLGVGTLVTGSLRQGGAGRVRVLVEVVDAGSGFQTWSESFVLSSSELLEGPDRIADRVGRALGARVLATSPHKVRRPEVDPVRMLRLGREAVRGGDRKALLERVATYERALELDPEEVRSYVALAESYHRLWERDGELGGTGENWLVAAEAVALEALERAPEDPYALTAYGTIRTSQRDWKGAGAALRLALRRGGGAFASHRLGVLLLMQGRMEEARPHVERSLRLDPLSPDVIRVAGSLHLYAGEPRRAISLFVRTLELDPDDFYAPRLLANAYWIIGEEDAAREAFMRFMPGLVRPLARIQDRLLGTPRGLRNLMALDIWASGRRCRDDPLGTALMWAWLEERERMLECLRVASRHHLWYVAVEPLMRPYHDDPRFRSILRDSGHLLPPEADAVGEPPGETPANGTPADASRASSGGHGKRPQRRPDCPSDDRGRSFMGTG